MPLSTPTRTVTARLRRWAAPLLLSLGTALASGALLWPTAATAQASEPAMTAAGATSAAPAVEAAMASAPEAAPAKIDNPYGLEALWKQGDFVARGTLIIMIIMSMGSWYIIITKLIEQQKLFRSAAAIGDNFWKAGNVRAAAATLESTSAFRYIAETGVKAVDHHEGTLVEAIDRHTWITMSVERAVGTVQSRLQDGLAFLATVGSTAPFIGLFGTVWGIYHALTAIGIAGQASIDKVAGPVGEALIMTAFGLAVAVPAVMGYNWLIRRNKQVMERVRAFSADVHNVLLAGPRA
ncbi:MAG: biopolymer transport protein ExbB [Pseudomonadota bacterium]|jgi:biopolymer transport protein ExbB